MPMEYRNQIVIGDARVLAERIPDESVDLIFTDPVYDRIDDYRWLAETAARVLKPDRACLVFNGIEWTPDVLGAMERLKYRWQFSVLITGGKSARFMPKGFAKWYSCLWMEKGTSAPAQTIVDALISVHDESNGHHQWSKNPSGLAHWAARFTKAEAVVLDPFVGGGTVPAVCKQLRRNYIAFEIDPTTAERARERVRNTQPPLFVPEPEQLELMPCAS